MRTAAADAPLSPPSGWFEAHSVPKYRTEACAFNGYHEACPHDYVAANRLPMTLPRTILASVSLFIALVAAPLGTADDGNSGGAEQDRTISAQEPQQLEAMCQFTEIPEGRVLLQISEGLPADDRWPERAERRKKRGQDSFWAHRSVVAANTNWRVRSAAAASAASIFQLPGSRSPTRLETPRTICSGTPSTWQLSAAP